MNDDCKIYCYLCGRKLNKDGVVWLELSTKTGMFATEDSDLIPAAESQGCFPFGKTCACKVLKDQPFK